MEKPTIKLVGTDGNVFAIIATVSNGLKKAGLKEQAAEFRALAFRQQSYDAVLLLCTEYANII